MNTTEIKGGLQISDFISNTEYRWQPKPTNVFVAQTPHDEFQQMILNNLRNGLIEKGYYFVDSPQESTLLGPSAGLIMVFGNSTFDRDSKGIEIYRDLPVPKGILLSINTVSNLPKEMDFHIARGQLVKKACHNGIIFEIPSGGGLSRAVWASMQGNYQVITGSQEKIFEDILLRILTHYGVEMQTNRKAATSDRLTWQTWCSSVCHQEIANAAVVLGQAGIIEDQVKLCEYDELHGRLIGLALNRSSLGESMRSALLEEERVMAITRSGGGKVNFSSDPREGHLVPVGQITKDGYVIYTPQGSPKEFNNPSVETFENGLVYLAAALAQEGTVKNFNELIEYLRMQFSTNEAIDILPEGLLPKVKYIDHFHGRPDPGSDDQNLVKIVEPDYERFPRLDFPCGSLEAAFMLLSALYKSSAFREPGPANSLLQGKIVIAVLPGHGSVALAENREVLTETLTDRLKIIEPERV